MLSNDVQIRLFGAHDLEALRTCGAQVARFEFRVGPQAGWDLALVARYAGIVDDLDRAGVDVIGLLSHQIVPRANQGAWNATNEENGGTTDGHDEFREQFVAAAVRLATAFPSLRL